MTCGCPLERAAAIALRHRLGRCHHGASSGTSWRALPSGLLRLHMIARLPSAGWEVTMAQPRRTMREGLIVGLIGYATVAVFYTLFDLLAGRGWIFTLNLLGNVLFRGVRDSAVLLLPMQPDLGAMFAYNLLHLVTSVAVGLLVASLVARVERHPRTGYSVLLFLVAGYVITVAAGAMFARDIAPLLPLWSIVIVNTLAAIGGGLFLWHTHPELWLRVRNAQATG